MFYTVYKITNLVNDKIYIGVHKTSDLSDDYMGSGKLIQQAIEKYGIENFKKEYISIFDNPEQMFEMESELVNEEFIQRLDTYNLKEGGSGGWDYINQNNLNYKFSEEEMLRGIENSILSLKILRQDDNFIKKIKINISEAVKKTYEEGRIQGFKNKNHSDEFKERMKGHKRQNGDKNSQYGTMWIYNLKLKESKRISKEEEIPEGWLKGRKIKF